MKYRKKPVVIEAMQFGGGVFMGASAQEIEKWSGGIVQFALQNGIPMLVVSTLEGVMQADLGDWIIKGIKGEFYPCKPDIFKATYERVTE